MDIVKIRRMLSRFNKGDTVRLATLDDLPVCSMFYCRSLSDEKDMALTEEQVIRATVQVQHLLQDPAQPILLMERDSQPIGLIFVELLGGDVFDPRPVLYAWGPYVIPECRTIGTPFPLMLAVFDIAEANEIQRIQISECAKTSPFFHRLGLQQKEIIYQLEI